MNGSRSLRTARVEMLGRAVVGAGEGDAEGFLAEADRWEPDDWTTLDETVAVTGMELLWRHPELATEAAADPTYPASGTPNPVTSGVAAAIVALPRPPEDRQGFAEEVRAASNDEPSVLDALLVFAHGAWLAEDPAARLYAFADVGVLLPLQLETRFLQGETNWSVRIRVIPQPPSIHTHEPRLFEEVEPGDTPEEASAKRLERERGPQAAADSFWRVVGRTGPLRRTWLEEPEVTAAFAALAAAVGPARAAWIATSTQGADHDGELLAETIPAGDAAPDDRTGGMRVLGLPPRLSVRIWSPLPGGGETVEEIGSLPQDPAARIPPAIPIELPQARSVDGRFVVDEQNWLIDWDVAVELGLAGTFTLPPNIGPLQLGGIVVAGLGDESPGMLLRGHVHTGALAAVELGAATNSVGGAPTAIATAKRDGSPADDGSPDLAAWHLATCERLEPSDPVDPRPPLELVLGRYLGAELPVLPRAGRSALIERAESLPDDEVPGTGLSRLMTAALWPSLWGASLIDRWKADASVGPLTDWALAHVSPEGPLPSVRIDQQPYGLLPVTPLAEWQPPRGTNPEHIDRLARIVHLIREHLYGTIVERGTVYGPDGKGVDEDRYAELLLRGGASRGFRSQSMAMPMLLPALDVGLLSAWESFFTDQLSSLGLGFDPALLSIPAAAAQHVALPLVKPPRTGLWTLLEKWLRMPMPALLDILYGMGDYAVPSPGYPSVAELYTANSVQLRRRGERLELPPHVEDELPEGGAEGPLRVLPDSLLFRLLAESAVVSNRWRARLQLGELPGLEEFSLLRPLPQPGDADRQVEAVLALARLVDPSEVDIIRDAPEIPGSSGVPDTPFEIDEERCRRLERALSATLDTVSTRIDPWATSFAWARLRAFTAPDAHPLHRLGAYGWVHGPFVGTPGPTGSGLLHTPSQTKTLTATILRDRYRDSTANGQTNEDGIAPWDMRLTGAAVRLAEAIVADLRQGLHLYEITGREVERILGGAAGAYQRISALRTDLSYAMYPDRPSPHTVCNGVNALAGLVGRVRGPGDPRLPLDPSHPLTVGEVEQLIGLRDAIDTISDLLAIDGLGYAGERRLGRAAGVMDAAAGEAVLPTFAFPRTDSSGFTVGTTALSVVPFAVAAADAQGAALAEPSVTAFLEASLPGPWTFTARFEDASTRTTDLTELGLAPSETLVLSEPQLTALARARLGILDLVIRAETARTWLLTAADGAEAIVTTPQLGRSPSEFAELPEAQQHAVLAAAAFPDAAQHAEVRIEVVGTDDPRIWTLWDPLGHVVAIVTAAEAGFGAELPPADEVDATVRRAAGQPRVERIEPPSQLTRARRLCAMLGAPATERDLAAPGAGSPPTAGAYEELRKRYTSVYAALVGLQQNAVAAVDAGDAGVEAQVSVIRLATRWGITPDASPPDAAAFHATVLGLPQPEDATPLPVLTAAIKQVVAERLGAAVPPERLPEPAAVVTARSGDPIPGRQEGTPEGVASLAHALSTLAAPQAGLPILIPWTTTRLVEVTGLDPHPDLDEWLTTVAPVRPALARVEAVQLEADPLATWSSSPDPWLGEEIVAAKAIRETRPEAVPTPRLRVAFGPAGALAGERVAVGIVDGFSEAIPLPQRATHAAFGFNAPAARAPQAILIAVPPVDDVRIDGDMLHRILGETRRSVIARAATVDDLAGVDVLARTAWLTDALPVGVLDPNAYTGG